MPIFNPDNPDPYFNRNPQVPGMPPAPPTPGASGVVSNQPNGAQPSAAAPRVPMGGLLPGTIAKYGGVNNLPPYLRWKMQQGANTVADRAAYEKSINPGGAMGYEQWSKGPGAGVLTGAPKQGAATQNRVAYERWLRDQAPSTGPGQGGQGRPPSTTEPTLPANPTPAPFERTMAQGAGKQIREYKQGGMSAADARAKALGEATTGLATGKTTKGSAKYKREHPNG